MHAFWLTLTINEKLCHSTEASILFIYLFLFAVNYDATLVVCRQPVCFLECSQDFQFLF